MYDASTQGGQSGGAVLQGNDVAVGIHASGLGTYNRGTRITPMMFNFFLGKKYEGIDLYN